MAVCCAVHSVAFLPYMERVFEEVFKLLEVSERAAMGSGELLGHTLHATIPLPFSLLQCPHVNVRKAAHEALGQFCCALHKACQSCPSEPNKAGEEGGPHQARWWAPVQAGLQGLGRDMVVLALHVQLCRPPWPACCPLTSRQ